MARRARTLLSLVAGAAALVVLANCGGTPRPKPRTGLDLTSTAERSDWRETGRYPEAVQLCRDLAASYPDRARCETFGASGEGRALVALVLSDGALEPGASARARRPVILVEAGIHAGEIEGKDAGFWLARDLLDGKTLPGVLAQVTVVFVPIINVDGHERFRPSSRPNQRGPIGAGFRTNGGALNLNRDFVKADSPEIGALLALWRRWDPTLFIDLHCTDGAKFEHDVAVLVAPRTGRADPLDEAGAALQAALLARLTALGHLPLGIYPSFDENDNPASGISDGEAPPRFSQFYAAARGRLGILVETHSWRTYPERVAATRDVLIALLERAVADGAAWRAATDAADASDRALAGRDIVLLSGNDGTTRTIDFRGYRYQRVPSEVSGALWTQYDEQQPEIWKMPVRDHLVPVITVKAPGAGYVIMGGYAAAVAERLDRHGLRYQRIADDSPLDVEVWRVEAPVYSPRSTEGRTTVRTPGAWTREQRSAGTGALFVPLAQPSGRLIMHLLEPSAPDALVNWGFFNGAFEQKEYMEAYVAEEEARRQLEDPLVRAAFEQALAKDPALAADPARRLDWFYRRSSYWDERVGLVPVFRVDVAPPLPSAPAKK